MARLGVLVGGRVRKLLAVGDHLACALGAGSAGTVKGGHSNRR